MTDESGHDKEQHDQLSTSNQSNNAYDSIDPSQTVIRPAPTPTPQPSSGPEILADGRGTGPADQPGRPDGGFGQPAAGPASVGGEPQRQPQTMPPNPPLPNQPHQSGGFTGPQGSPRPDQLNGPRPGWQSGWQPQGHSGPYVQVLSPGSRWVIRVSSLGSRACPNLARHLPTRRRLRASVLASSPAWRRTLGTRALTRRVRSRAGTPSRSPCRPCPPLVKRR